MVYSRSLRFWGIEGMIVKVGSMWFHLLSAKTKKQANISPWIVFEENIFVDGKKVSDRRWQMATDVHWMRKSFDTCNMNAAWKLSFFQQFCLTRKQLPSRLWQKKHCPGLSGALSGAPWHITKNCKKCRKEVWRTFKRKRATILGETPQNSVASHCRGFPFQPSKKKMCSSQVVHAWFKWRGCEFAWPALPIHPLPGQQGMSEWLASHSSRGLGGFRRVQRLAFTDWERHYFPGPNQPTDQSHPIPPKTSQKSKGTWKNRWLKKNKTPGAFSAEPVGDVI